MKKQYFITLLFFILGLTPAFAQKVIKGKVTDAADGNPIPGVSVSVKGQTGNTVVTNNDGSYTITVQSKNSVLVYTYIGYTVKEVTVGNGVTVIGKETFTKSLAQSIAVCNLNRLIIAFCVKEPVTIVAVPVASKTAV